MYFESSWGTVKQLRTSGVSIVATSNKLFPNSVVISLWTQSRGDRTDGVRWMNEERDGMRRYVPSTSEVERKTGRESVLCESVADRWKREKRQIRYEDTEQEKKTFRKMFRKQTICTSVY